MMPVGFQRLAFALVLLAAALAPAFGQRTDAWREKVSRDYAAQVEAQYSINEDPAANQRVADIVKRLLEAADAPDFSWQFRILATDQVNAFALPNGFIYVYQGLLDMPLDQDRPGPIDPGLPPGGRSRTIEQTITDDELAFVLGHEISHVIQSHVLQMMRAQRGVSQILRQVGLGDVFTGLLSSGFSREYETESDQWGLSYVLQAGYDPRASLKFFQRMQLLEAQSGPKLRLFPSHPRTADRIKNLTKWIGSLKIPEAPPGAFNGTPTEGLPLVWIPAAPLPEATGAATPVLKEAPQVAVTAGGAEPERPERERVPEELARRMKSLLVFANVATSPGAVAVDDPAAARQAAEVQKADVLVTITVDDFRRTRMPWPGGVSTRYEVAVSAVVVRGRDGAVVDRLKATASREGTMDSAQLYGTVLDDAAAQLQEKLDDSVRRALGVTEPQRPEPAAP